jgi:hypothetical protein
VERKNQVDGKDSNYKAVKLVARTRGFSFLGANAARLTVEHHEAETAWAIAPSSCETSRLAPVQSVKQIVLSHLASGTFPVGSTDTH